MTNDEIRIKAATLAPQLHYSSCPEGVLYQAILEAVSQAYEEAAQRAESLAGLEPWYDTHGSEVGEAEAIAFAIRALKDSLDQKA